MWLDPEESRPLVNAFLAEQMMSLRDELAASIRSDNVSVSDYRSSHGSSVSDLAVINESRVFDLHVSALTVCVSISSYIIL